VSFLIDVAYYLIRKHKLKSEVMKTMKMKTANLFLIFGFLWLSLSVNSQDVKLTRQEKKAVRKAQMAENFVILDSLLNSRNFILEADFLLNKYGNRIPVTSTLNFVKADHSRGVLQTGSDVGVGYNGVGGVTAEGSIGVWKLSKDIKHLSYSLQFNLLSNVGIYDIFLRVTADNHATATITGLWPGSLSWEGHLKAVGNSRVFKGMNTI
jgi:hypothetical protein